MKRFGIFSLYIVVAVGVLWHHQAIADWWTLRSYEPSSEIQQLANDAYLSEYGQRYFYVSDPQINNKEEFNRNCPVIEEVFVLGCYSQRQIFVLDVEREELDGVMEVTAAHEMLHAAYHRLSARERDRLNDLLEDTFAQIEDDETREQIERYRERGGREVMLDELHSILPTQIMSLSPELEDYFDQYFTDRSALVVMYENYRGTFSDINDEVERLQSEIFNIREQINAKEAEIARLRDELDRLNAEMDRLRDEDDNEAFNELVPQQNQLVSDVNQRIDEYDALISSHNARVNELNDLVLLQNDLVNSLDSTFESI